MTTVLTADAPHGLVLALLGLVALAYLAVAVVARVALHRLTRTRRTVEQRRLTEPQREEVTS